ncbi:MAG: hypothetical protein ACOWWR_06465, partial [Eubacteriales bacterium]
KIKPLEIINQTLDSNKKLDGLLFTEQMKNYCGNQYQIQRMVDSFFNEHQMRTFRPRSPIYILKGLFCEGELKRVSMKCDRTCYLFWHQDWLEKINRYY